MRGVVVGAVLASVLLLGSLLFVASSGAFSQARHEWKVEVFAQPSEIWSVRVPRIVADARVASPSEREALDALLADLGSTKGRPEVSLRDDALVLGRGDASVTAARSFYRGEREAFLHWTATGADVSRLDEGPADVQVTWTVYFHGGLGHTCWAQDSHTVFLTAGDTEGFTFPSNARPYEGGRLWRSACA